MAVEYRLTLATDDALETVAAHAVPDPALRPTRTESGHLLAADLYDQLGFSLTITAGRNGYSEAEGDDDGMWVWEPEVYVDITFRMDRDEPVKKGLPNVLTIVARVLDSGSEDAALILQGDILLLTRFGGVLRKHSRSSWWDHYGFVNQILPG